jgi:hypothetical protein
VFVSFFTPIELRDGRLGCGVAAYVAADDLFDVFLFPPLDDLGNNADTAM